MLPLSISKMVQHQHVCFQDKSREPSVDDAIQQLLVHINKVHKRNCTGPSVTLHSRSPFFLVIMTVSIILEFRKHEGWRLLPHFQHAILIRFCVSGVSKMHVFVSQLRNHIFGRIDYRMPHDLKNFVNTAGACSKGWVGGRLGSTDAHHDGHISWAYLHWPYPYTYIPRNKISVFGNCFNKHGKGLVMQWNYFFTSLLEPPPSLVTTPGSHYLSTL